MSAGINASVHFSIADGWHAEFGEDGINSFTIESADPNLPENERDAIAYESMMDKLENEILPIYYDEPARWVEIAKNGMNDILAYFNSARMVQEYYEKMYNG